MNAEIIIDVTKIPAPVMAAHCRTLFNCIGDFFEDPTHQREFEDWHVKTYGCMPKTASYMTPEPINT